MGDKAIKIMGALAEIIRGGYASALWISGLSFTSLRIVLTAKTPDAARRLIAAHSRRFLDICQIKVTISGTPPKAGSGCVLCHNEASFADVAAYLAVMWPHVDRAAGADLYAIFPFMRAATRKAAIELVPRGNRAGTERLIEKAVLAVKSGERLGWGGEGRISGQDGVARFKVGASLVAIRSQAPIIPVMIYGGHRLLPLGSIRARRGEIHIRFGAPISTTGLDDTDARALADKTQAATAEMYADFKTQEGRIAP
ncbi:1-acyl-sn-glycerol-3-phosphate acyltransferase [Yoonia rosea]|uniref:1-acyl-sn-glycerol-3-phosphate acyltransferase n=1 Tax=Yoonia rosea TaxID=287098 RepID=A0A1R3X655_9RHOB|nr:1-acyl-sn-glycerol-3-phosphate acyltransferase [Yoonia rosea]